MLKGVITKDDWKELKENIAFDYLEDNYFSELKEGEITRERFEMLSTMDEYVGKYISHEWIRKNILRQSDDEIKEIKDQIDAEKKSGEIESEDDLDI
jgi:hypothetical protein